MVRKTKQEAEETRESILQSAAVVFVDKGVAGASLEEIARHAGVTRGAVYWHFKNKVDIFTALHEQLFMSTSDMILQELKRTHPRPLEQLRDLCVNLFNDLEKNPQKKRILTIFFIKCDYTGEFEGFLDYQQKQKTENFGLLAKYFQRAIEKGHLPEDSDPDVLTQVLNCFITGMTFEYLRHPELFKIENTLTHMIDHFFRGLPARLD